MKYTPQHAATALEIMKRLAPAVAPQKEYEELIAILEEPKRWVEAHAQFTAIRTKITLPAEEQKRNDLDSSFAYVAENAAKTAYNCSGADAPFDDGSFQWLLRCEKQFLEKQKKWANQRPDGTSAKAPPSNPSQGAAVPHP
jgi:hypothetical protein